jgi:hypothetical protein
VIDNVPIYYYHLGPANWGEKKLKEREQERWGERKGFG